MIAPHPVGAEVGPFEALEAALAAYRQAVLEHERAKGGACCVALVRARCLESEARLKVAQVGVGLRLKTL